jgi:hypothetical protein
MGGGGSAFALDRLTERLEQSTKILGCIADVAEATRDGDNNLWVGLNPRPTATPATPIPTAAPTTSRSKFCAATRRGSRSRGCHDVPPHEG